MRCEKSIVFLLGALIIFLLSSSVSYAEWSTVTPPAVNSTTVLNTDGSLGDDDLIANGAIRDQGGPGQLKPSVPVPAMNGWGMIILMLLAGCGAMYHLRKRKQA